MKGALGLVIMAGELTTDEIASSLLQKEKSGTLRGGGTYGFFPEKGKGNFSGLLLISPSPQDKPRVGDPVLPSQEAAETESLKEAIINVSQEIE